MTTEENQYPKPQVLVLDDSPQHLSVVAGYIERHLPIAVVAFSDSTAAMEAIGNTAYHFDAFVLDIEMIGQKYTGIDVAEKIRETAEYTLKPIIFLSSYAHFSFGALKHIHYYEFLVKNSAADKLSSALRAVLFVTEAGETVRKYITVKAARFTVELDAADISSIELYKNKLKVVDILGREKTFNVKPNTFLDICEQLKRFDIQYLQQVHRTVIINMKRIRSIEWQKNTAVVRLFNVDGWVPAGKTYLQKLDIYKG